MLIIDGNTVITKNLKLTGNVTWDMTNSPVLSQYSVDGSTLWHSNYVNGDIYMRMSFDGGTNWSNATKIVGADGAPGDDADVTPENVFNALTDGGKTQGLFNANGDLYINAEYIKSGIIQGREIKSNLSSVTYGQFIRLNSNDASLDLFYKPLGGSEEQRGIIQQEGGFMRIKPLGAAELYIGNTENGGNLHRTWAVGVWKFNNAVEVDFTGATVTGLSSVGYARFG